MDRKRVHCKRNNKTSFCPKQVLQGYFAALFLSKSVKKEVRHYKKKALFAVDFLGLSSGLLTAEMEGGVNFYITTAVKLTAVINKRPL